MKFYRSEIPKKTRPITSRRLKIAERKRQEKINSLPLFSPKIAAEILRLETPIERLSRINNCVLQRQLSMRKSCAQNWLKGRKFLRSLSEETRKEAIEKWNNCSLPKSDCYFLTFLRKCYGFN